MTIIRCAHDATDHQIVRAVAQNRALSYEALGLLTYLLSQPDDWVIGVDDLIREGCKRDKVYRLLKELTKAGHLVHERVGVGQHKPPVWTERTVYEQPVTPSTKSVKAGFGAPVPEKPDFVNTSENPPVHEMPDLVKPPVARAEVLAFSPDQSSFTDQELNDKNAAAAALGACVREELPERPNAFAVWEQEMGTLTPTIGNTIRDWIQSFPAGWAEDAIREAKLSGGYAAKYVQKILDRWQREGKNAPRPAGVKGAGLSTANAHANGASKPAAPPVNPPLRRTGVPAPGGKA